MKKTLTILMVAFMLITSVATSETLTSQENYSLKLAEKFIKGKDKSFYKPDGSVVFLHGGSTLPSVLAAPLRITDIALEPGENIKEVQIGDTVRWVISPAISGSGDAEVSHVIIKPTEAGLQTTLAIFTDRRSYHMNLKSTSSKYFPFVTFAYADQLQAQWDEYKNYKKKQEKSQSFTKGDGTLTNVNNLDFNYRIKGSASWKPTRVYNDGVKTFIELPYAAKYKEVPALLVLDEHDNEQLVNYRFKDGKYVVDKIFDAAALVLGVGSDQTKIVIVKSQASKSSLEKNFELLK